MNALQPFRVVLPALIASFAMLLSACGGGSDADNGDGSYLPPGPVSTIGTTGTFVAFADPSTETFYSAPISSYAGKRQSLRGTIDFTTGVELGQHAGVEIYKGSDGHIYELDLTSVDEPQPQQVSTESAVTVDDTCSLSGSEVPGASYAYTGVYFAADLHDPVNSTYFYRLPGASGSCNSANDSIRMVKTGMSAVSAPIPVSAMPVATVHTALGGISGFVVVSGAQLLLVDGNFANPVVLATFASPIGVASVLPVGLLTGYPSGQLFVVDGNVLFVNYVSHTTSAPLHTIPNWTSTSPGALFAASPTTLYLAENIPASTMGSAATASVLAIPADGSAPASFVNTESGRIQTIAFPVNGTSVLWGVSNGTYSIRATPDAGGAVSTLATASVADGTFLATAAAVYYTTWSVSTDPTTQIIMRHATSTGIVSMGGDVIQAPLFNSTFVSGGGQIPWPDDSTTAATAYETIFQVQGLSTVTLTNPMNGRVYSYDAVSGGTLVSIDAVSNQQLVQLGTVPQRGAVFLSGTFRDADHNGFIEATTPFSTTAPATRGLYILNSHQSQSLARVTGVL